MKTFASAAHQATLLILIVTTGCSCVLSALSSLAAPSERSSRERLLHQTDQIQPSTPALDIARAVPYPVDFAELAIPLGFLDGRFVSGEDQARRAIDGDADNASLRSVQRQLLRVGWLRRYESRLAAPIAGDPEQFGAQVSSFVVEYASPQDAANAFAALAQQDSAATNTLVGDESLTLEFAGTTPDTSTEYQAVKLVFRVGQLLCSMTFADLTGKPPSVDAVISAGRLVSDRARIVLDQGTVPLGSMLLQFSERGNARNDVYATRAGVQTILLSEETLENFALPQSAGDAFISQHVSVITNPDPILITPNEARSVIEIEGAANSTPRPVDEPSSAPSPEVSLFTALYSFNADSEALNWLTNASTETANGRGATLAPIESPLLGIESAAFQLESTYPSAGFVLFARFGTIGIIQELRSSTGVSLEGAANVMRQQLACVAQFGCSGVAELPKSVFGGRDVPLEVNLSPEARQESAAPPASVSVNELPLQPEDIGPVSDPALIAPVEEPAPAETLDEVPEELTEPEITSAPAQEEIPEDVAPVESPAAADPTPIPETSTEPLPTSTPESETPGPPDESQVAPATEPAETPTAASPETPVPTDDTASEPDPVSESSDNAVAAATEATAAPVPADSPIGGAPPPVDPVVQTPSETETPEGATPDYTEPVPAASEAESGNDNGERDSRRDRDRKKDRDGRDDKK